MIAKAIPIKEISNEKSVQDRAHRICYIFGMNIFSIFGGNKGALDSKQAKSGSCVARLVAWSREDGLIEWFLAKFGDWCVGDPAKMVLDEIRIMQSNSSSVLRPDEFDEMEILEDEMGVGTGFYYPRLDD